MTGGLSLQNLPCLEESFLRKSLGGCQEDETAKCLASARYTEREELFSSKAQIGLWNCTHHGIAS